MQSRYSRQIILQNIGEEGQEKLLNSSVAIVGCGALGTVAANNLARAGVGKISIIDGTLLSLTIYRGKCSLMKMMLVHLKQLQQPRR